MYKKEFFFSSRLSYSFFSNDFSVNFPSPYSHIYMPFCFSSHLTFLHPLFPTHPSCCLQSSYHSLKGPAWSLTIFLLQLLQFNCSQLKIQSQHLQMRENMFYLSFCIWVTSLGIIISSFIDSTFLKEYVFYESLLSNKGATGQGTS